MPEGRLSARRGPLLTTKLYIPPRRATLVSRPQLTARLNQAFAYKLSLLSAPPGFGKTTLLGEWIPTSPHCVAWLSLDEDDNALVTAGTNSLTINAGAGNVSFTGQVGGDPTNARTNEKAFQNLTISSAGAVTVSEGIATAQGGTVSITHSGLLTITDATSPADTAQYVRHFAVRAGRMGPFLPTRPTRARRGSAIRGREG